MVPINKLTKSSLNFTVKALNSSGLFAGHPDAGCVYTNITAYSYGGVIA